MAANQGAPGGGGGPPPFGGLGREFSGDLLTAAAIDNILIEIRQRRATTIAAYNASYIVVNQLENYRTQPYQVALQTLAVLHPRMRVYTWLMEELEGVANQELARIEFLLPQMVFQPNHPA